ncbi:MAG: citrate synthase/methylcitrate synthase, partial [Mesorhizobium sp.]
MANGLDDVVAAETVLSDVDGAGGHLTIRGHSLTELAGHWRYGQVVRLLFDGFFDELPGDDELEKAIGNARVEVCERLQPMLAELPALDVYSGMRTGIALLPDGDSLADALRLIAVPAVLTPALLRLGRGEKPVPPDARADHANDMLRMLSGTASPA